MCFNFTEWELPQEKDSSPTEQHLISCREELCELINDKLSSEDNQDVFINNPFDIDITRTSLCIKFTNKTTSATPDVDALSNTVGRCLEQSNLTNYCASCDDNVTSR